jgi:hypothetical protein
METGIKSSFIPQGPVVPVKSDMRRSRGGGFDFIILASLVVFVASATLAVGVFLYAQYLSTSVSSKLAQLERAKQAFEPALIQDLTRLDDRMRAADIILQQHMAPTTFFHLLEQLTLQTVAFSALDFGSDTGAVQITMRGIAQSVNSIALQADLLSKSGVISNPIFSNMNRSAGGVNFDFAADINPEALRYQAAAAAGSIPVEEAPQEDPTSPFGTPGGGVGTSSATTTP